MRATIKWHVAERPHPFDKKQRKEGVSAVCLIKVTRPEADTYAQSVGTREEVVAMFNFDSEGYLFRDELLQLLAEAGREPWWKRAWRWI